MKSSVLAFRPLKHLGAETAAWCVSANREFELDEHQRRLLVKASEAWLSKEIDFKPSLPFADDGFSVSAFIARTRAI